MYKVKYECDLLGNHMAPIIELCEIDIITFNNAFDAVLFIENRRIEKPFSKFKDDIANIHLIINENDFKQLI